MIEEDATVIALEGEHAIIEVARQSSCGQCAAVKGCGTAVFANWYGKRMNQMRVINPIHAVIGDQVVVGMKEDALLKASLLVYMMPLLMMGVFAIAGRWLANEVLHIVVSDAILMLLAVLGLVLALLLVRRFQRRVQTNPDYHPVILRRRPVSKSIDCIIPISKEF
jgi:sigma-E factor negative regulatory protein RseC